MKKVNYLSLLIIILPLLFIRSNYSNTTISLIFLAMINSIIIIIITKKNDKYLKAMIKKSEQSNIYFKKFFRNTSDVIWETDNEDNLRLIEGRFEEILKIPKEQFIGHKLSDFAILRENIELIEEVIIDNVNCSAINYNSDFKDAKGRIVNAEITRFPKIDNNGKFCGFYGFAKDVTNKNNMLKILKNSEKKI